MDGGPSKFYPSGNIKFAADGRREGAGLTIIPWQNAVPVTIYPPELAMAKANWPKK
jgi:branched-chain amino acid transport system substrate-binding protein